MAGPRRSSQPALKGMALDEMCRAAREERRRTERRRDALRRLFPQMEELADGTTKRFRILGGFFQCPSTEELLELERTIEELRNQHVTRRSVPLSRTKSRIMPL